MSARLLLEIAANSLESALAAQTGGADRVELCENLGEGGCTPAYGTLTLARERLSIPLYVLIRPRGGDFVYSPLEWEAMRRDVETCVRVGCDGVVIGALTAQGTVDGEGCRSLVEAAGPLGVTFHRAFDCVANRAEALEQAVALGCERILTSGGADTALQGAPVIAADIRRAAGRLRLLAGAGLTADNIAAAVQATGACEFHASAKALQAGWGPAGPAGLASAYWRTDVALVRQLRQRLDACMCEG